MENRRVSIMVVIGLSRGLFRANKKNDNYERVTIILLGRCLSRFVTTFKTTLNTAKIRQRRISIPCHHVMLPKETLDEEFS